MITKSYNHPKMKKQRLAIAQGHIIFPNMGSFGEYACANQQNKQANKVIAPIKLLIVTTIPRSQNNTKNIGNLINKKIILKIAPTQTKQSFLGLGLDLFINS